MSGQAPAGWEGILDPGEVILWQGRPDKALHIGFRDVALFIFGLFFAGFALFWMVMASQAGGVFWMFGLIHFSVGLGIMAGGPVISLYRRRHLYYTLTDRRAFIASDAPIPGRSLQSYPIAADTPVTFHEGRLSDVHFATRQVRAKHGHRSVAIGFDRIENGRHVMSLIRQVQRGDASPSSEQRPDA